MEAVEPIDRDLWPDDNDLDEVQPQVESRSEDVGVGGDSDWPAQFEAVDMGEQNTLSMERNVRDAQEEEQPFQGFEADDTLEPLQASAGEEKPAWFEQSTTLIANAPAQEEPSRRDDENLLVSVNYGTDQSTRGFASVEPVNLRLGETMENDVVIGPSLDRAPKSGESVANRPERREFPPGCA